MQAIESNEFTHIAFGALRVSKRRMDMLAWAEIGPIMLSLLHPGFVPGFNGL